MINIVVKIENWMHEYIDISGWGREERALSIYIDAIKYKHEQSAQHSLISLMKITRDVDGEHVQGTRGIVHILQ